MERMLEELGPHGKRAWDLLDRVAAGTLALPALFDAFAANDLDGLRTRLDDVDLTLHIAPWEVWIGDRVKSNTADHYVTHLRTLMPEGKPFLRSAFTAPAVARWLADRTALVQKRRPSTTQKPRRRADPQPRALSGSSKRRYLAAVRSFAAYLVEVGVLTTNPVRDVSAPPANDPRCQYLELPDVLRLVEGASPPYRALFALAYGAGLEVSALLSLVDTDVDLARRQLRARGTKAWTRDRIARVADWAWPHVVAHLATLTPGERLSRGIHRWAASDAHRERLRALGLVGYRLHDSRHHWAVRMVRVGMPLELCARQLGHRDVMMVARVYGRFVPNHQERDRWEQAAAALDVEKWGQMGTTTGTSSLMPKSSEVANVNDASDFDDSRGGTRTRDPGIMSAVL
jgi:integrase